MNIVYANANTSGDSYKRELIGDLLHEANAHSALNHRWLKNIATHGYTDQHYALKTFAYEYHTYAGAFPHYLRAVIDRLTLATHKEPLLENLAEEKGKLDAEEIAVLKAHGINTDAIKGIAHPVLYRRFCHAMGLSDLHLQEPAHVAMQWRTNLLDYIKTASPAAAVGAIGIGTEGIVKPIYEKVLSGIRALGTLSRDEYAFFDLHCVVDDKHAEDLKNVAIALIDTKNGYEELRAGMLKALELRALFWDHMDEKCSRAPNIQALENAV
ncbi:iron-containing redox enzyme family protein [Pseudomonadota bacterium]